MHAVYRTLRPIASTYRDFFSTLLVRLPVKTTSLASRWRVVPTIPDEVNVAVIATDLDFRFEYREQGRGMVLRVDGRRRDRADHHRVAATRGAAAARAAPGPAEHHDAGDDLIRKDGSAIVALTRLAS